MASVRQLQYRFCPVHNATELFRDLTCLECEREAGVTEQRVTKPQPTYRRRHYAGRLGRPRATDLTPRERTIAELVAKGLTQAEVARELGIVRAGISSALERAKARIGVKHVWELVRYVRGGGRP